MQFKDFFNGSFNYIGEQILHHLDYPSIVALKRTCKYLYQFITHLDIDKMKFNEKLKWHWQQPIEKIIKKNLLKECNQVQSLQLIDSGHSILCVSKAACVSIINVATCKKEFEVSYIKRGFESVIIASCDQDEKTIFVLMNWAFENLIIIDRKSQRELRRVSSGRLNFNSPLGFKNGFLAISNNFKDDNVTMIWKVNRRQHVKMAEFKSDYQIKAFHFVCRLQMAGTLKLFPPD